MGEDRKMGLDAFKVGKDFPSQSSPYLAEWKEGSLA